MALEVEIFDVTEVAWKWHNYDGIIKGAER